MRVTPLLLLLALPAALTAQERQVIQVAGTPANRPFSPAIRVGNLVFASGQIGIAPGATAVVPGGIGPETRQAMENLDAVFKAAGTSLANAVKCTVFLADIAEWPAMNEVYVTFFRSDPPARSAVAGSGLALRARVEIECIAVMPT